MELLRKELEYFNSYLLFDEDEYSILYRERMRLQNGVKYTNPKTILSNDTYSFSVTRKERWTIYRFFDYENNLHSRGSPAELSFHSGILQDLRFFEHGKLHRLDGPATYKRQIDTLTLKWKFNNATHSLEGPAFIWY